MAPAEHTKQTIHSDRRGPYNPNNSQSHAMHARARARALHVSSVYISSILTSLYLISASPKPIQSVRSHTASRFPLASWPSKRSALVGFPGHPVAARAESGERAWAAVPGVAGALRASIEQLDWACALRCCRKRASCMTHSACPSTRPLSSRYALIPSTGYTSHGMQRLHLRTTRAEV